MDELAPGTMRVKHKLIPQVPFIVIGETDFNPEIHEKILEENVDKPIASNNNVTDQAKVVETDTNPELPPDVIKVKHKLINIPFIVINKSDFDPEIHSLFDENSLIAAGDGSIAIGDDSIAAGDDSIAIGDDSIAIGDDSIIAGDDSIIAGDDSIVAGDDSIVAGDDSESETSDKTKRGRRKAAE
jgi:hypothetical protein